MGLIASIYTDRFLGTDTTKGGFSGPKYKYKGVCIVNITHDVHGFKCPFEPCDKYYPVLLICDKVSKYCKVVPARKRMDSELKDEWIEDDRTMDTEERGSVMFGGNFCYSGDSRVSDYVYTKIGIRYPGAFPIHDRIETAEEMRLWRD